MNALNRLKNILPCKTKEALYCALFCLTLLIAAKSGTIARKANKLEKVNDERALRLIYKDNYTSYQILLKRIVLNNTLRNPQDPGHVSYRKQIVLLISERVITICGV